MDRRRAAWLALGRGPAAASLCFFSRAAVHTDTRLHVRLVSPNSVPRATHPTHPPTSFLNKLLGMRLEDQDLLFSYFAASMDKARQGTHCNAALLLFSRAVRGTAWEQGASRLPLPQLLICAPPLLPRRSSPHIERWDSWTWVRRNFKDQKGEWM